ncbi:MAG: class I SAM-dependent methyltransferase [Dehalococcoidia bacterium]
MSDQPFTPEEEQRRDAFAGRLLSAAIATFDVVSVYMGDRLGFYRALADGGAATPAELAARSGCHERYVREWLEQQAATGILSFGAGRFSLPREYAEVLLDTESLNCVGPIARLLMGAISPMPRVLEAYRRGGGVLYGDYGPDLRDGQADINRSAFLTLLPGEWIPAMPDIHARLQAQPPARVADVGCGAGWSSIGVARAFPHAIVDGLDLDEASVELARQNVAEAGLGDRVNIQLRNAGDPALAGQYDLVLVLEALHDMSDPVAALSTTRRLCGLGGCVFVADERVAETFAPPAEEIERLMYGWSIVHCLPAGMAEQPSAGTGTVMRAPIVRDYAQRAGFSAVEEQPLEHLFFRFYRLTP